MIRYRTFRNTDPPALAAVWNESCTGRSAFPLVSLAPIEFAVFSKPYFDPNGLVIAEDNDRVVGFALAGFGPDAAEKSLDKSTGVICALSVRPEHRRQKVGAGLLERIEAYLTGRGAKEIVAGPVRPFTPFFFGVYGNSDLPGFLESDADAAPFYQSHGYQPWCTRLVFDRVLTGMEPVVDSRFLGLRRRFDVQLLAEPEIQSWWQECVLGHVEPVEFRLVDKLSAVPTARVLAWEMNTFRGGGAPMAGIIDVQVRPEQQRQGQARFLLSQMMRYLQEQFFCKIEIQCDEGNEPCRNLLRGLGFSQVDVGRSFKKTVR